VVEQARKDHEAANMESSKAKDAVDRARRGLEESQAGLHAAVVACESLSQQKSLTGSDLSKLYLFLVEQEKKQLILIGDAQAAQAALKAETELRSKVATSLDEAIKRSQANASEVEMLRKLLDHSEQQAEAYDQCARDNAKLAADAQRSAAEATGRQKTWRNMAFGEGAVLLVLLGFFLLRRSLFPLL
jgi:hypothetical protein